MVYFTTESVEAPPWDVGLNRKRKYFSVEREREISGRWSEEVKPLPLFKRESFITIENCCEEDRVEEGVNIIHFPSATDIKDKVRDNSDDNIYQMSPVLSEDNTHGKRWHQWSKLLMKETISFLKDGNIFYPWKQISKAVKQVTWMFGLFLFYFSPWEFSTLSTLRFND